MRPQQTKQVFQVVSPRNGQPQFDQERLQEFLGGLLAAETNNIIYWWSAARKFSSDAVIDLGLADPIGR